MIKGKGRKKLIGKLWFGALVPITAFSGGDEQGIQVVRRTGEGRPKKEEDQAPGRSVQDHRTGQLRADSLPPSLLFLHF